MRYAPILVSLLLSYLPPAVAQLSINFNTPGVSIGIDVPVYPQFERVPGYPVYYAPQMSSNYFFYDGLYWVYNGDNWYASNWYNGPWGAVDPFYVPAYVLRVPVRYYRHAPSYFSGWGANDPPRWGDHWGHSWEDRRVGWNKWNRSSAPSPAPLPVYQRQYSGDRYPQATQQVAIQVKNYSYQPKEAVAQQQFKQQRAQAPAPQAQPTPRPQQAPKAQPQQAQHQSPPPPVAREQAPKAQPQQSQRPPPPAPVAREPQAPKAQPQQAQRQPPPPPVAREQPAPKAQPQQAQRPAPQAPAEREQQAPKQEAKGRDQGNQGHESKEKDPREKGG